jgi:hypothetical protein
MKRVLLIFLVLGCIGQEDWTFYVIDETVTEYTLGDIASFEIDTVYETVIEKEIRKVKWEGVAAHQFGEGDTITFISEDGYLVSIPYDVQVIVAYKKDGEPIDGKEGGPLKIAVDPLYGCKCNWLKYLKIVEFVHAENSLSVYGDVVNMLTFSPRDLNLYYGLEDVMNNTYREVPLTFILDKALCKENATKIVFITEEGRFSFLLSEVRDMDLILVYDSGFQLHGLGITNLKGIKIE